MDASVSLFSRIKPSVQNRLTKFLSVALELERLDVVLADQVAQSSLGESNARSDLIVARRSEPESATSI
jgi:hypothetical protein